MQLPEQNFDAFGEIFECRLSNTLTGTLYTIPDISCILDTQDPKLSITVINTIVETLLEQMLLSPAQRAIVTRSSELYQDTIISKIRLLFQEILCYTTWEGSREHSQQLHPKQVHFSYTLLATNKETLKKQIDLLQAHPDKQPYFLITPQQAEKEALICSKHNQKELIDETSARKYMTSQQACPAFTLLIRNDLLSDFIKKLSQTNTFSLLFPRYTYPLLYQSLPFLTLFLESLPPVWIEAGIKGTRLYLVIQMKK